MPTTISGTSLTVGSIDLTTPLATADGGSKLAQIVTYQNGDYASGTTTIPLDNTIPQNTEGDQYMSLSITPTNINSTLEINVTVVCANSVANYLIAALFRDSAASAVAVGMDYRSGGNPTTINFTYYASAISLSPTTFKIRLGGNSAGITYFNSDTNTGRFLGTLSSRITIKEYLP